MVKRILGFSLFLAVFLAVFGAMNYYVYFNLVNTISMSSGVLTAVQAAFVLLACAYPLSQFLKPRIRLPILTFLGAIWMGTLSISIAVFALKDLVALVTSFQFQELALAIAIAATLWAAGKAWQGPKLKRVSIRHRKLSRQLGIVHLSDLHLGTMTSSQWLEGVVEQVNRLEPDIIVITGDVIDDSYQNVQQFVPAFKGLKAKLGIYAVSGNHEYYQGIEHFREFCLAAGVTVADDRFLAVAQGVNILGLGGKSDRAGAGLVDKVQKLLTAASPDDYNILLIHHPVGFRTTAGLGIDLQLSGHTHRGQILPMNILVYLVYRHAYGLYNVGDSYIYTSSGTGTWGPPLRLGSSSEIVSIQVNG